MSEQFPSRPHPLSTYEPAPGSCDPLAAIIGMDKAMLVQKINTERLVQVTLADVSLKRKNAKQEFVRGLLRINRVLAALDVPLCNWVGNVSAADPAYSDIFMDPVRYLTPADYVRKRFTERRPKYPEGASVKPDDLVLEVEIGRVAVGVFARTPAQVPDLITSIEVTAEFSKRGGRGL